MCGVVSIPGMVRNIFDDLLSTFSFIFSKNCLFQLINWCEKLGIQRCKLLSLCFFFRLSGLSILGPAPNEFELDQYNDLLRKKTTGGVISQCESGCESLIKQ